MEEVTPGVNLKNLSILEHPKQLFDPFISFLAGLTGPKLSLHAMHDALPKKTTKPFKNLFIFKKKSFIPKKNYAAC
jgi:hypothetical protein